MKDLYQILSGIVRIRVNGFTVIVEPFSLYNRYLSEVFAEEKYEEAFSDGHLTQEEAVDLMIECGFWSEEDESNLISIPKNIEQMKVDYFNNHLFESSRSYIEKNINFQKKRLSDLNSKKSEFFNSTCEYIRNQYKICYLVEKSSKFDDGTNVDLNKFSIFTLVNKYSNQLLDEDQIRAVAKSDSWRTLWLAGKSIRSVFGKPIAELTDQQVGLINWSRVYDNVYESTECPSEEVINDDYALDGWFIIQKRKREDEKKKQEMESKMEGRSTNAGEVFLPVRTKSEIQAVYDLNSTEGKLRVTSIEKDLKKHGSLEEGQLSSTKKEIALQRVQKSIETMKGRK